MRFRKDVDEMTDRLTDRVGDLRDRATAAVQTIGDGPVSEEMHRVGERLDRLEDHLTRRLADLVQPHARRLEELAAEHGTEGGRDPRRTTWPRRAFWAGVGAGMGMVAAYFADPDRGRQRRTQARDQAMARGRDLIEDAEQTSRHIAEQAKGVVAEAASSVAPEDVPSDPRVLEQRIRSDVFGHRDDVQDVVIVVDAPGEVSLKGTVPSEDSLRDLVSAVGHVDGVRDVQSELAVRGG